MRATTKHRTVRVSEQTHEHLVELSEMTGLSMTSILERAVDRYRREQILREANRAWAAIMDDPAARAEYEAEQRILDGTLQDGLEDEKW